MTTTRRQFISQTAAAGAIAASATLATQTRSALAAAANETINLGVIGVGGRAMGHVRELLKTKGVKLMALCDADKANMAKGLKECESSGVKPTLHQDMREVIDNKDIHAVVISTPNHWHALATIWACQAGKDVYVEKPVTHNLWEGTKVLEAARKYDRIVQAGTQNRSDTGFRKAIEAIRADKIGEIQWLHGLWYKQRRSIGKVTGPQAVPESVDYDLWTGPAPLEPLKRQNLHYDWHWNWNTGNADMGNLGAHQLDDCAHVLNLQTSPKRFLCMGGRYTVNDDGQTPNVQAAFFEFDDAPPVIVEVRGLPKAAGARQMDSFRGINTGNVVQCEGGYFAGGRGGGAIYDNRGKLIQKFPGDSGATHMQNWIDAIRSRDRSSLRAEIEVGIRSANLCHLANLAYRSGSPMPLKAAGERAGTYKHAEELVGSLESHLTANRVDVRTTPVACSDWMQYDESALKLSGGSDLANELANALVKPAYREPFVVPEQV